MKSDIQHLHHVGMLDLRGDSRLVQEHVHEVFVPHQVRQHHLHGQELLEATDRRALHRIHCRHAAVRDLQYDPIAVDSVTDARQGR